MGNITTYTWEALGALTLTIPIDTDIPRDKTRNFVGWYLVYGVMNPDNRMTGLVGLHYETSRPLVNTYL